MCGRLSLSSSPTSLPAFALVWCFFISLSVLSSFLFCLVHPLSCDIVTFSPLLLAQDMSGCIPRKTLDSRLEIFGVLVKYGGEFRPNKQCPTRRHRSQWRQGARFPALSSYSLLDTSREPSPPVAGRRKASPISHVQLTTTAALSGAPADRDIHPELWDQTTQVLTP